MVVPFTSLLTFSSSRNQAGPSTSSKFAAPISSPSRLRASGAEERTPLPPPTSHILCTTNYPAPASFPPIHYARCYLQAGGTAVWIGCTGAGEAHVRRVLKSRNKRHGGPQTTTTTNALADGVSDRNKNVNSHSSEKGQDDRIIYIDAYDSLSADLLAEDARSALLRLQHKVDKVLERVTPQATADTDVNDPQSSSSKWIQQPLLVVLDDLAALSWSILKLSPDSSPLSSLASEFAPDHDAEGRKENGRREEDPRLQILRSKRRGGTAIHVDEIGKRLAIFIQQQLHEQTCSAYGATLLSHISCDNTSIIAPPSRTPASRGGSYGVGTGFDADDAGEEDEETELYEEHPDDWLEEEKAQEAAKGGAGGVAEAGIDWRVDSLLRQLLTGVDFWLEFRGLRSGRARDCHGEICVFRLRRPCLAANEPLPSLPMPADPLHTLRAKDRFAKPLKQLSSLSLNENGSMGSAGKRTSSSLPTMSMPPLYAWRADLWCEGREKAMLFRIEANGDAVAWSRSGAKAEHLEEGHIPTS